MKFINVGFVLILILVGAGLSVFAQTPEPRLVELRHQFALHYIQPEAHFALAKYFIERGDKYQAFYIIETARRYRFEEKEFDAAYTKFFGDPMPEPTKQAKDEFELGFDLVKDNKYDEAEKHLVKAASLGRSFFINAWVGRYYFKTRQDEVKALPYYFDSYFLYPHANETEYVESRIRHIAESQATASYAALKSAGTPATELTRDRNPLIVMLAIEELVKNWKPEYLDVMLDTMGYDDGSVRWTAFVALKEKAGTKLDSIVTSLLVDTDLRKRGLAAYALIELKREKAFAILEKLLADPAELIRFDAISALAENRPPAGQSLLRKRLAVETNKRMKFLITEALK